MSTFVSVLSICAGACAGALLRWLANITLNPVISGLGTLAVNLTGGFIMGIAISVFALFPASSPEWKLLVITGFLGSLTTFSAFSGEMAALISQDRLLICAVWICLHVFGSIVMVFLGMMLVRLLRG